MARIENHKFTIEEAFSGSVSMLCLIISVNMSGLKSRSTRCLKILTNRSLPTLLKYFIGIVLVSPGNAGVVIEEIAQANGDPQTVRANIQSSGISIDGSVKNILNAYDFVYCFLMNNYDDDAKHY